LKRELHLKSGNFLLCFAYEPLGDANVEQQDGFPLVRLSRLIKLKIASVQGSLKHACKFVQMLSSESPFTGPTFHSPTTCNPSSRNTFRKFLHRAKSA
jgi:hypothetical protein